MKSFSQFRSVWRVPEFAHYDPPPNWTDQELYCGATHQVDNPGTNCGVCGDSIGLPTPRPNEIGGQFYRGIITGRYASGGVRKRSLSETKSMIVKIMLQVIDIEVQLTAAHGGFMEFRLCTNPHAETQDCFNQHLLQRTDGQGSRIIVDRGPGDYGSQFQLPAGVTCQQCILQWNYRAGNMQICVSGFIPFFLTFELI